MVDIPRKTYPELSALTAPVVDSDVIAVYRSPNSLRRTTAATFLANVAKINGSNITDPAAFRAAIGADLSSNVDFTPSGGNVTDLQTRGRKIIFADEYDTLQDAIDEGPATGGFTVLLPSGYDTTLAANLTITKPYVVVWALGDAKIYAGTYKIVITATGSGFGADPRSSTDRNGTPYSQPDPMDPETWLWHGPVVVFTGTGNVFEIGVTTEAYENNFVSSWTIYAGSSGSSGVGIYAKRLVRAWFERLIIRAQGTGNGSATITDPGWKGIVLDGSGSGGGDPYVGYVRIQDCAISSHKIGVETVGQVNHCRWEGGSTNTAIDNGATCGFYRRGSGTGFVVDQVEFAYNTIAIDLACPKDSLRDIRLEGNTTDVNATSAAEDCIGTFCFFNTFVVVDAGGANSTNSFMRSGRTTGYMDNDVPLRALNSSGDFVDLVKLTSSDEIYVAVNRTIAGYQIIPGGVVWMNLNSENVSFRGGVRPGLPSFGTQTAVDIYAGTGAPSNSDGTDGDTYIRSDGGAMTTIYQKRTGAWVGIV